MNILRIIGVGGALVWGGVGSVCETQKSPVASDTVSQLMNTDAEPDLHEDGFVSLFDGETLHGWTPRQGTMPFEARDGAIVGTCVVGSLSTFLCTDKTYTDFIFTCEARWEVDGNSGIQVRSKIREELRKGKETEVVFGPQVELEDMAKNGRGWSGGIYGQSCGGWKYRVNLPEHETARKAIDHDAWNRVTVKVVGNVFKTWVNGVPVAHWVDEAAEFSDGFIGLQVHGGKQGTIHWKSLRIREL